MKHTEEKWVVSLIDKKKVFAIFNGGGNMLVTQCNNPANARLIASAPDLLEACKMARKHLDILICMTPTGKQRNQLTEDNISILQAISRAEGE